MTTRVVSCGPPMTDTSLRIVGSSDVGEVVLRSTSLANGYLADPERTARVFTPDGELRTGDLLVGYTDGISEAMNPDEEEWGEDAMLEIIHASGEKPADEILRRVVEAADKFADGAKQHDDMTMVIIKVL